MVLPLYRSLVICLAPVIRWHMNSRAARGAEDMSRLSERYGIPSAPAFSTRPLWLHAASVGEALSALTLIDLVRQIAPDLPVLLTTGTVTSAQMMNGRLPQNCVHQYAPLDHPSWIKAFLDHWQPCAALRIESEIWPHTLLNLHQRKIPITLINGRLSDDSFRRWGMIARSAQKLMRVFAAVLADGDVAATRFTALGATPVYNTPNIKFIADPPPVDIAAFNDLQHAIGTRPVWLYASTHADEETIAADLHRGITHRIPNVLTIIVPRHPARSVDIRKALSYTGLSIRFRSDGHVPDTTTDIYVADTMGELGLFYHIAPIAMIGRSFSRDGGGGHNPVEAALCGCYPMSGPAVQNLQTIFDHMLSMNAVELHQSPADLTQRLPELLGDPAVTQALGQHAQQAVLQTQATIRDQITAFLSGFIPASSMRGDQ